MHLLCAIYLYFTATPSSGWSGNSNRRRRALFSRTDLSNVHTAMAHHIPVSLADVLHAVKRIETFIHKTPCFTSATINKHTGRNIYFKAENLQKTGSFKIRGALNAVSCRTIKYSLQTAQISLYFLPYYDSPCGFNNYPYMYHIRIFRDDLKVFKSLYTFFYERYICFHPC